MRARASVRVTGSESGVSKAPLDALFALLIDSEGAPSWSDVNSVQIDRSNESGAHGEGIIRMMDFSGLKITEQITGIILNRRIEYRIVGESPVSEYQGAVEPVTLPTKVTLLRSFATVTVLDSGTATEWRKRVELAQRTVIRQAFLAVECHALRRRHLLTKTRDAS